MLIKVAGRKGDAEVFEQEQSEGICWQERLRKYMVEELKINLLQSAKRVTAERRKMS